MNIEQKKIGIIGYGSFGKIVCNNLFPKNQIILFSKSAKKESLSEKITLVNTIEELIKEVDIIIPCVPIRNFEQTIKQIAATIKLTTIVMDICSVKEYPTKIMKQYLPNNQLIASHPMFGPNSIHKKNGNLQDMNMVLWNISSEPIIFNEIKNYLKNLSLHILEISPEEHDKLSAHTQFFTMMIGQIVTDLELTSTIIDTPGAKALFEAMQYTGKDKTIIEDMIKYNKYCQPLLTTMIQTLEEFNK